MTVESATYISGLVSTNPGGGDQKKEGDNHIRLLKATLQATFPNITGAVTPTHTELNYVDGVTSAIQTQIDGKVSDTGDTLTGTYVMTGATISGAPTATLGTTLASTLAVSGTSTVPTPTVGDNSTNVATTAFVVGAILGLSLPGQTGKEGFGISSYGGTADWGLSNAEAMSLYGMGVT